VENAAIDFEQETEDGLGEDLPALAALVAGTALSMEGCPWAARISLVLTDDEGIRRVNSQFRGIDSSTDVLSFPSVDFSAPSAFEELEDDSFFDMETGELLLGDIMISADRVRAQAQAYGHSIKREFCFLTAHSVFHLLGYDHMEEDEAAVMEQKQEAVLEKLGITR